MRGKAISLLLAFAAGALLCACGTPKEEPPKETPEEKVSLTDFKLTKEYFEGKKVVVYGDSITMPVANTQFVEEANYIDLLARDLGFVLLANYAVPSTTATHSYSVYPKGAAKEDLESGPRYVTQHEFVNETADYALIMYGANDFTLGAPIGTDADVPQSYGEVTTYKGGIRFMVETLRKHNPDIRIQLFTPLYRAGYGTFPVNGSTGLSIPDYGDALFGMKDSLQVRVLDTFPVFSEEIYYANSKYTKDGTHPNDAGHALLEAYILDSEK